MEELKVKSGELNVGNLLANGYSKAKEHNCMMP